MSAVSRSAGVIHPDALYSRRGFLIASGICEAKLREAKREHRLECRRFWVGKRCFYRGSDIILFLEELAAEEIRRVSTVEVGAE